MGFFREILAEPFGWALGFVYDFSGNYLFALVVITLVLRLALLPSSVKQQKNSAKQMRLQAKVNKIKAKYAGGGREAQMKISEETQELYRREGFNATTAGCLPLVFQLVVMMGLYGAIYSPVSKVLRMGDNVINALTEAFKGLPGLTEQVINDTYRLEFNILNRFDDIVPLLSGKIADAEIGRIQDFIDNFEIFGINLTQTPSAWQDIGWVILLIPILSGVTALLTALYTFLKQRKTNPEMAKNPAMGCMTFFSPAISVYFAYTLPAGVGFYWIISNILSFIQMIVLSVTLKPADIISQQMIDETVQRRSREQSVMARVALMRDKEE